MNVQWQKNMQLIDANVILRYLLNDSPQMSEKARNIICSGTQKKAVQLMADELDKVREKHGRMTFHAAGEEYIESKRNVPDEDIMRFGGRETDHVMKGVYRHAMQDHNREMQRSAAEKLGNVIL